MFVKVFDGNASEEVEKKINDFLGSDKVTDYDLHSLTQSESMMEINGKIEKHITITCIFIESLFGDEFSEDD